jgi:hypothetical protein
MMNEPIVQHPHHPQQASLAPERPKKIAEAVIEALRAEFRSLVDGNLDDNLTQIEQLASKTRELFLTMKGPESRMMARHPMAGGPMMVQSQAYAQAVGGWAGAPNVEQFGASAVRQVVENLPDVVSRLAEAFANSPARQIEAIAAARRNGMEGVAEQLEKRLLAPPAAVETHADEEEPHPQLPIANGTNGAQTNGSAAVGAEA